MNFHNESRAASGFPIRSFPIFILAIIGITANITLLVAIASFRRQQESYYTFVMNIVLSDLLASVMVLILTSFTFYKSTINLSKLKIACKVFLTILLMSWFSSILSFTLVSIHRLELVYHPTDFRSKSLIAKYRSFFRIATWIICAIVSIPFYFLATYDDKNWKQCDMYYPFGQIVNVTYCITLFGIGYITPTVVILTSYIRMAAKLLSHGRMRGNLFQSSDHTRKKLKKVTKFLAIATIFYIFFSLPVMLEFTILSVTNQTQASLATVGNPFAWVPPTILAINFLTSVVNPILFLSFDKNVKSFFYRNNVNPK